MPLSASLWASDGTTAGTTAIKSFTLGPDVFIASLRPGQWRALLISGDPGGYTIWKS